ncbi:MAG: ATP-binding protein [Acidobacteriota bacterium]
MSEQLCLRIENRLPELERVHAEVENFLERCDVAGRDSYHIRLALDELVTNVICYAYDGEGGHCIDVHLMRSPGAVTVTLMDSGKPFNPLLAPEPDVNAPPEKRRIGGLGIHFVRKTMDELHYERRDGMNVLRFRKDTAT